MVDIAFLTFVISVDIHVRAHELTILSQGDSTRVTTITAKQYNEKVS